MRDCREEDRLNRPKSFVESESLRSGSFGPFAPYDLNAKFGVLKEKQMITVITRFAVPTSINATQMRAVFAQVAPAFRNVPGLIRKQFLLSADGHTAGGVYLWEEEEAARSFMHQRVAPMIREKFQVEPTIEFYHSPVLVER